jgi:hypothetical protein
MTRFARRGCWPGGRCPGQQAGAARLLRHFVGRSNYYSNMSTNTGFAELREQAIALRRAGKSRREIKLLLAIGSNATLTEALRGEPPPEWTLRPSAAPARHPREPARAGAAARIGALTDREVLIAGAIAYWCEGAKNKQKCSAAGSSS